MINANFYNTHLRKTSDPTSIRKNQMERGMVVKIKYKRGGTIPKLYLVFVLQPRWPQTSDGKLHGLSLDNVSPQKFLEFAENYEEIIHQVQRLES